MKDLKFNRIILDINKFETQNDLTQDLNPLYEEQQGTFKISDGTEYGFYLTQNLNIYKKDE
jgi:hypothetical protein